MKYIKISAFILKCYEEDDYGQLCGKIFSSPQKFLDHYLRDHLTGMASKMFSTFPSIRPGEYSDDSGTEST